MRSFAIRVAIVISIATAIGFYYSAEMIRKKNLYTLKEYVQQRSLRESSIFQLVLTSLETLRADFIADYKEITGFKEKYFVGDLNSHTQRRADGTIRSVEDFDSEKMPGLFIAPQVEFTPRLQRKLALLERRLRHHGFAWRNKFLDTYASFPEKGVMVYWPNFKWTNKIEANHDITKEVWFYSGLKEFNPERKIVWTGIYYDSTAQSWMTSAEAPVDVDGVHVATFGHDILLTELISRSTNDSLEGTYNFIIQPDGRLVTHPKRVNEIKKAEGNYNVLKAPDPELSQILKLIANDPSPIRIIDDKDHDQYLGVAAMPGVGWYFVTVYPAALIRSEILALLGGILILATISLLVEVLLLYWVLRKQVTQPLEQFVRATKSVEDEHNGIQLEVDRQDEIGELARSFSHMSKTVFKRTLDLKESEQRERESRIAAEKSITVRDEFISIASHELKTPLTPLKLSLQMVMKSMSALPPESQPRSEFLKNSLNNTKRQLDYLTNLIENLLDVSRIGAGYLGLSRQSFDLRELVQAVLDRYEENSRLLNCSITFHSEVDSLYGFWDPNRIEQVIINLLTNAMRYGQGKPVEVRLGFAQGLAQISVRDHGVGIAPEDQDRIFNRFERGSTQKYKTGLGLGLYIAREIVSLHSGQIKIESRLHEGALFTVELPVTPVA